MFCFAGLQGNTTREDYLVPERQHDQQLHPVRVQCDAVPISAGALSRRRSHHFPSETIFAENPEQNLFINESPFRVHPQSMVLGQSSTPVVVQEHEPG